MKRTYVEVSCDHCGQADYYKPGAVDAQAKEGGWVIVGRKHFCNETCKAAFKPHFKAA